MGEEPSKGREQSDEYSKSLDSENGLCLGEESFFMKPRCIRAETSGSGEKMSSATSKQETESDAFLPPAVASSLLRRF